ncbi:MAG: MFS transporter [Dehalococcoidia bacterium]|nr:MFS transporter [Dehalococcoidia bacterium]
MRNSSVPHLPVPTSPQSKGFRLSTFSSLQYRDYRYLWTTTIFTSAGNWIQQITLGWLVFHMTGSALLTGTVSGVRALPFLFVGPLAGVIADRVDRKLLLILTHIYLSLLGLGFAILIVTGLIQVWHIFVFSFLGGVGWAILNPVRQTLVPALVPSSALMNAIALNSAAFNATRVIGPAIGGVLIAAFGPATNFFIQSAAYFAVTIFVLPIRIPARPPTTTPHASILGDLKGGLKYVSKDKTILALIMVALVPSVFMMPFTQGLMPVFAKSVLGVGPEGLGILLASAGAGALVGTLALASLGNFQRKGVLLLTSATIAAASLMLFSRTTWLPVAAAVLAIQGGFQMVYNSTNNTVLQIITPDEYRGRVMSIYMLDHGLMPLGSFMAGALAEIFGAPMAILAAGAITTALVLLLATQFRQLRQFR